MPVEGVDTLQEAIDWFKDRDIELYGVNENPTQHLWTESPKPYANYYIDDSALGCPTTRDDKGHHFVDWSQLDHWFKSSGIINTIIK